LTLADAYKAIAAGAQGSDVTAFQAVVDAQAVLVGADDAATGLTAALNELADGQDAKTAALVAALDNELVADEAGASAETASDANVDAALVTATSAVDTELDAAIGSNVDFAAAGASTKTGLIADGRAAAQTTISDQEEVVATAEAATETGVVAALDTVEANKTSYEAAIEASNAADVSENAEAQKYIALNSSVATLVDSGTTLESDSVVVANNVNGTWTVAETTAAVAELDGVVGFDTYLASLQAKTDAANAQDDAEESLLSAIAEVAALENDDSTITADDIGSGVVSFSTATDGTVTVTLDLTVSAPVTPDQPSVVETTPGVATSGSEVTEVNTVTFESVVAGQVVTVAGQTFTASADATADQVASAFAAGTSTLGSLGGTLADWTPNSSANGAELAYTSDTASQDVTNISASAAAGNATTETAPDANTVLVERGELATAEVVLADLNEAIAVWEALVTLNGELSDLDDAVTAAEEAITDTVADGGLGISLLEGTDNFTANDDVYLYADGADQSLTGFGSNGEDKIFFGEEFSLVQIPTGDDISDNVGDAGASEVLWVQDGNDLVLYVEEETFAGNSAGGAANDITTITLTGVDAADVSFADGFLSAGTAV
jgi:hypothetical protein